jgi:hypothetical protein
MVSNLVTPPDIVDNQLHSVLLVAPDLTDLDAVIRFCQYATEIYNVYVYTPNMDNHDWLSRAVDASDAVIVNSQSGSYQQLCLLDKTYYYGDKIFLENPRKITDPLHYFAVQIDLNK